MRMQNYLNVNFIFLLSFFFFIRAAEKIGEELYARNWELLSFKNQRIVMQVILQAQSGARLTAWGFDYMNFETLLLVTKLSIIFINLLSNFTFQVIKTAYNYFTVLMALYEH